MYRCTELLLIMFYSKFCVIFFVLQVVNGANGANILALLPSASRSHHIFQTPILEELANKGHNVILMKNKIKIYPFNWLPFLRI